MISDEQFERFWQKAYLVFIQRIRIPFFVQPFVKALFLDKIADIQVLQRD